MPDSTSSRWPAVYPVPLREAEAALVNSRRGNPPWTPDVLPDHDPLAMPDDTVGVALSGGGIRSATFCLGVFRALARLGLVRRIDFLSTVSGGGYFGAFLGALFVRHPEAPEKDPQAMPDPAQVEDQLLRLDSKPVAWLRENGRYMSPNGAGDTLLAGAVLLRNWIAVLVVISALAVTAFAAVGVFMDWMLSKLPDVGGRLGIQPQWMTGIGDWPSPVLVLPLLLVLLGVAPLGLGYWFTQRAWPFGPQKFLPPLLTALIVLPLLVLLRWQGTGFWLALASGGLAALWWAVAWVLSRIDIRQAGDARMLPEGLERNRLSRWLSVSIWIAVGLALFAGVDFLGRMFASPSSRLAGNVMAVLASAAAAALGAFGVVQKLLPLLESAGGRKGLSIRPGLLLPVLALVVVSLVLVGLSTLTHWLGRDDPHLPLMYGAVLTGVFAWTLPFLNLSSHNTLYAARLTRAYLGASNPERHKGKGAISETIPGDGIAFRDYRPFERGGPLHLINVTVNETVSGKSQLEQRDRKGLPLAIGPCGVSVGSRHHATWVKGDKRWNLEAIEADEVEGRGLTKADFHVFPAGTKCRAEELGLGEWVSISGAAFSTGVGSRTSFSLSLLLGLANVRLGYWWNSGIDPGKRLADRKLARGWGGRLFERVLPVYAYFLYEFLARFHGPARRRWYLSDGGHFENTGAYELLRRRVPFILLCDDGCDPKYQFDDLAGLVRKARVDLDAEIAFYPRETLTHLLPRELAGYFGAPDDFRAYGDKASASDQPQRSDGPHALLAGVFYEDPERQKKAPDSVLLVLKPSVSGDEPLDVVEYGRTHPSFPQESTMDQFFDEAQWESYRRLGEHIASRIFGQYEGGIWHPSSLMTPPPTEWPGTLRASGGKGGGDVQPG